MKLDKLFLFIAVFIALVITCSSEESCGGGRGVCLDTSKVACQGVLLHGQCKGPENILCCEEETQLPKSCNNPGRPLHKNAYLLTLESQGFTGHPGALVYVPSSFRLDAQQKLSIVVWVHGYHNCVENIVRLENESCNCSASQNVRVGYNLISQFDEAVSKAPQLQHTVFIASEVAYDQANDSPGKWAEEGIFKSFIEEALAKMSPSSSTSLSLANIDRVRIFSHSGGYYTIGNMWAVGGLKDKVRELVLFDSLYANFDQFDSFVNSNLQNFGNERSQFRFSSLYTSDGGTAANNVNMAQRVKSMLQDKSMAQKDVMFFDDTLAQFQEKSIAAFPILFKRVNLTHDQIPQQLFKHFLTNSF